MAQARSGSSQGSCVFAPFRWWSTIRPTAWSTAAYQRSRVMSACTRASSCLRSSVRRCGLGSGADEFTAEGFPEAAEDEGISGGKCVGISHGALAADRTSGPSRASDEARA